MFFIFTHVMKPVRDTNSEPGLPVFQDHDSAVTCLSLTIFTFSHDKTPNRGTQGQFLENIYLRSRILGIFVLKFLACLPLLGFSNI